LELVLEGVPVLPGAVVLVVFDAAPGLEDTLL
jgi:hypothetical protein